MIHVSVRVPSSSVFLRSVDGVIELGQDGRYTVVEHAIQSFEADHLAALDKLLQRIGSNALGCCRRWQARLISSFYAALSLLPGMFCPPHFMP
jgi:hypothetical protein